MIDLRRFLIAKDPGAEEWTSPISDPPPDKTLQAQVKTASLHSDAITNGLSGGGLLWQTEIKRCIKDPLHADAVAARVAKVLAPRSLHADSGSSLPALALRNQSGPDIWQPTQERGDILDTIPTRNVPGDDIGYWYQVVRFGSGGGFVTVAGDQTEFNTPDYSFARFLRPLHWCGIALSRGWMEKRQTSAAGVNDIGLKLEAIQRAYREYKLTARLSGFTGLDLYSLASIPGLLRWNLSIVFGTAAIETARADVIDVATRASELSAAGLKPNMVIITDRIKNRLLGTSALPTADNNGWVEFKNAMSELGITQIVEGKSLRDLGGTNIDGMLFLRTEGEGAMTQVEGNALAPVWTYNAPSGENTIYAASYGDLENRIIEGSLLALVEVT